MSSSGRFLFKNQMGGVIAPPSLNNGRMDNFHAPDGNGKGGKGRDFQLQRVHVRRGFP